MRWRLAPILDAYLLREIAGPFSLALVLFTLFLFVDRLYSLADLVIAKGVPLPLVLQLLGFMLPPFLAITLPMALLVGVLVAGGRLAADLEVVALKAGGVSVLRLLRPVLACALVVTGVCASLTLWLNPLLSQKFHRQLFRIVQARAVTGLKERVFSTAFGELVVYVEEISASQMALRGILVADERDARVSRVLTAREGRLLADDAAQRITLRLLDGEVSEVDLGAGLRRARHTTFSVYDTTVGFADSSREAARFEKPERDASLGELARRVTAHRDRPDLGAPWAVELHKRFAQPLAALVFALVGVPVAIASRRGGRSLALVATLAILVAYYVTGTALEGAALRVGLPAWVAAWGPNALFGAVGALLLLVVAREWRGPRLGTVWHVLETLWERFPSRPPRREDRVAMGPGDTTLIIDRYLLRRYVGLLALGLAVAAALLVVADLVQTLDRFLRAKPPLRYVAEHFLYQLPPALYAGLPIIMLVGTISLFVTLARWHELTALKAAGLSLYRVSAPVLLFAAAVTLGSGLFQELLLPVLNERGEEVDRVKIRGQLPRHLQTRARLWLRASDTRFYRVDLLNPGSGELLGVTILDVDRTLRIVRRLDARRARWIDGRWEFSDGAIRELGRSAGMQSEPFQHRVLDLPERLDDFTEIQKPTSAMSYRELRDYIARLEQAGFQAQRHLVDLHARLSSPLKSLIMALVAIPLALQAPRAGRLYGAGLAIAIMAAYLVVDYSARAFARADLLPPLLGAWTANVVFAGLSASLFLRTRT